MKETKPIRKTNFAEDSIKETPTDPVKSFAHVQLEGLQEFMTLCTLADMVGEFTSDEGTVEDKAAMNKSILVRGNV